MSMIEVPFWVFFIVWNGLSVVFFSIVFSLVWIWQRLEKWKEKRKNE